jgi:cytosine/adenosine deaminase-related metal-dependent hydrolase
MALLGVPTEYLARSGVLSNRLVAAHCRCMTAEEERLLGASGAAVAVNPAIAARRGLAARIDELERAGCWLAPGNRADLILIDLRKPHLTPALRVVSCFVHQGLASDVEAVMVDGHWIMRDGRVLTLDEPALVAEADRIARAAWRRLFERRPDLPRPPGFDLGTR